MELAMEQTETRIKLETAFLDLLKVMPYEDITNEAIAHQAGLPVSDYNRFFTTQRSVVVSFLHRLHRQVQKELELPTATAELFTEENLTKILVFYGQYREEYLAMSAAGFTNLVYDETCDLAEELLKEGDGDVYERFRLYYATGGMLSAFFAWLSTDDVTAQELGHAMYQMVCQNFQDLADED